jgi:hypothetical protein
MDQEGREGGRRKWGQGPADEGRWTVEVFEFVCTVINALRLPAAATWNSVLVFFWGGGVLPSTVVAGMRAFSAFCINCQAGLDKAAMIKVLLEPGAMFHGTISSYPYNSLFDSQGEEHRIFTTSDAFQNKPPATKSAKPHRESKPLAVLS